MNAVSKFWVFSLAFYASSTAVNAQPILIGCTANVNATSPTSNIVDINPSTGLATNPRNTGIFLIGGIATQVSTNTLFGLTTIVSTPPSSLITIDPNTGGFSVVGATGISDIVEGDLAFNPLNGMLYGVQSGTGPGVQRKMFRIDSSNGLATTIGPMGTTGDISAIAFSPGGVLYGIDSAGTSNSLMHTFDTLSGTITSTTQLNFNLGSTVGMTFDPASGLAYVADGGDASATGLLFSLDVANSNLVPIGPTNIPGGISGLAIVGVPEPSSAILVGIVLTVKCLVCPRRRNQLGETRN